MPPAKIPEKPLSKQEIFQGIRRFLAFLIVSAAVISIISHTGSLGANLFQYHPIMVTCAFVGALPEVLGSVGQMKAGRAGLPREEIILRHQLATFVFNMCAITGIAAVEYTKYANGYPHLISSHGLVGSVCGVALVLQMVIGNILRYAVPRRSRVRPVFKTAHGLLSVSVCITGLMCLVGGLLTTEAAKEMIPAPALRYVLVTTAPTMLMWGYMH